MFENIDLLVGIVVAVAGGLIGYATYQQKTVRGKHADELVNDVVKLKAALYSYDETVKFLISRHQVEIGDGSFPSSSFESLEKGYRTEASRLANLISGLTSSGRLLFLFDPGSSIFVRTQALRWWLEVDSAQDHPLHEDNGQDFVFNQTILQTYIPLMSELHMLNRSELRSTVQHRLRSLADLDNVKTLEHNEAAIS